MLENNLLCDSCGEIITPQDERVYCDFKGHEYNFCCDHCAGDWLRDHQEEINSYVLYGSGLFQFEEPERAW